MKKTIITVVGNDGVGIIARVCTYLAEHQVNILDITQTILDGYFNMMMITDASACEKTTGEIAEELNLSQKTVEAHMHEALRFLRDNLALLLWLALFNDGPVC